jgi:spore coat polysaccharide biosynthesis protein SpsF (cytidylyltransferase family)
MKTLVFLYVDSNSLHLFDKVFDGKSAFYRSLTWADSVEQTAGTVVLACDKYLQNVNDEICDFNNIQVISQSEWNVTTLLEQIRSCCEKVEAENVVYAFADCPFLNLKLTQSLLETHTKYCAEYTFADGYPYGFAPEVISSDVIKLFLHLNKQENLHDVKKDSLFSLIK